MIVDLTEAERLVMDSRYSMGKSLTLAWRAFGKTIGISVDDPLVAIDGDGSQREPITRRYFDFEEANEDRYLSLAYHGCWDGGAMRSLSPNCTYISYSVCPDRCFVNFHGWYIPKEHSRILGPKPVENDLFLTKDQLFSMDSLIATMKLQIMQAEQEAEEADS